MDTYSFVMRGLLTEEALDKTGRKTKRSLLDLTEAQLVERLGITLIDDDLVERSQKMSYIFVAICSFENSVREFISKKLLEEKGADWWEQNVKSDVRKRAENRKTAEDGMRWLSPRGENPINYTEFGDLISIVAGNWELFEPHLGTQEWAQSIITPLEKMRNIIMHGGELDARDIERVGINIRDWMNQVG